jgi:hypothetical protein
VPDPRPKIIQDTGFAFDWDDKKVWKLPIKTEEMSIGKLLWHLDLPVWEKEGTDDWNLTPNEVLKNPKKEPTHFKKIEKSDLKYPIDVMLNHGKYTLLDGYHRLAKAYRLELKSVKTRKIPRKYIPQITTFLWKDYIKK